MSEFFGHFVLDILDFNKKVVDPYHQSVSVNNDSYHAWTCSYSQVQGHSCSADTEYHNAMSYVHAQRPHTNVGKLTGVLLWSKFRTAYSSSVDRPIHAGY
jgi:hypothetical protein